MIYIDIHLKIIGEYKEDGLYHISIYDRIVTLLKFWQGPCIVEKNKLIVVKEFNNEITGPIIGISEELFRLDIDPFTALDIWRSKCVCEREKKLCNEVFNCVNSMIARGKSLVPSWSPE